MEPASIPERAAEKKFVANNEIRKKTSSFKVQTIRAANLKRNWPEVNTRGPSMRNLCEIPHSGNKACLFIHGVAF
ncbi:MAG: hypothetical protein M0O96_04135 [Desulforhopalus sp.]|nr:hypothetical protein [Desulforhopalus sp.]